MFGKGAVPSPPDGETMPRWKRQLLCYLLMAFGSVIGMLLADGFRWYDWRQGVYSYAVCAFVFPFFAALAGLLAIATGLVALIEESSDGIPFNLILILGGVLYFWLWRLAVRHSFGSRPPWQRWAWRTGLVASSAAATYCVLRFTAYL